MAAPLGQVVFKVPELGKQGYALEQQEQARQEKKRKERDTELYRTGGEKAFNDNGYKLQGIYKTDMQTLFGAYEAAGERYEQTGDPSALREAKQLSSQMKQKVADYNTQIGVPLARAAEADEVRWNGYVGTREDFDNNLNNILNPSNITASKYENGNLMYQIDGKWVPESATPRGQRQPNAANTVPVQKSVKLGTYFAPSAWEKEHKFLTINAESAEKAYDAVIHEFEYELEDNPELQADVALSYAIAKRELDPRNISNEVFIEVMDKFKNDKVFEADAMAHYKKKLGKISANRFASQATGGGMFGGDVGKGEAGKTTEGSTSSKSDDVIPEMKFDNTPTPEEKRGRAEQRLENIIKKRDNEREVQEPVTEKAVQGPPTAEDEVTRIANEIGDTQLEDVEEAPAAMKGQSVKGKGTPDDPQSYKNRGIIPKAPKPKEGVPMPVQSKEVPTKSAKAYYTPVDDLTWTPQTVKKAMDRWNTDIPVPYEDFIYVSNKFGIPVELIIAMSAQEGAIGVGGRQVKTKNFFNWDNTTPGDKLTGKAQDEYNRYFASWRDGLEVWADGLVRMYRPEDGDWSKLWEGDDTFVTQREVNGVAAGRRYADGKNYEQAIRGIINGSIPRQLGNNYIAAR